MDVDIYGDLDNLDNQFEVVQQENEQLKDTVQKLEETSIKFSIEINELKRINSNLEVNISSLFKTAKAEIERKNKQIAELRKDLDNMLFKRGPKNKSFSKNNDCQDKEIITKQFEKAQTDLDQKNRIIQSLNTELESVRKELQERNNMLKRNSSQIYDDNESHTTKKQKLDRETFVDNEDEYRSYKSRHEMRENGMYNSKYKKFSSRGRGYNDLRSRIDLKRINYRRSRSRSREGRKYNKNPRNAHYKGTYKDKPESPDCNQSNRFQKYAADYLNAPEDEKQRYYFEHSEYNSAVFNRQTTDYIVERKLFDSPTFRNIKAGDVDNACATIVDIKREEINTATVTCNSSDLIKTERITCEDLNKTTSKETFQSGHKKSDSIKYSADKIEIMPVTSKNQAVSNVIKDLTLIKPSDSNNTTKLNDNGIDLIEQRNTSQSNSTSSGSVKEFIIDDTWEILHRVKRNKKMDKSKDKSENSKSEKNTIEKENSKIKTNQNDDVKIIKNTHKNESTKSENENLKSKIITDNNTSLKTETKTHKKEKSESGKNTNEKGNVRSQKNTDKNKLEKIKKSVDEKDNSRSKNVKEVKENTKSQEVKEIKESLKLENSKHEKDHTKSEKSKDKKSSSKTSSDSDAKKEKSSKKISKLILKESSKIVKSHEKNNENSFTKIPLEDKIQVEVESEGRNMSVTPNLKLPISKTSHEGNIETVVNLDNKTEKNLSTEDSAKDIKSNEKCFDNKLLENLVENTIKTDDMEIKLDDSNISIVTELRPETTKRVANISESDTNILLVSEKQPSKSKVNETSNESPDTNISFVSSENKKVIPFDITKNTNSDLSSITNIDSSKQTHQLMKEINDQCSDKLNVVDEKCTNEFSVSLNSNSSTTLSANSPVLDVKENNEIKQTVLQSVNTDLKCSTENNSLEINTELQNIEVPTQSRPTIRGRRRRCIISIT